MAARILCRRNGAPSPCATAAADGDDTTGGGMDHGMMDEVLLEGPDSAPELVCMIHGWPDDLHLWDRLVADMLPTGKYRCLRVTMPGYGHRMGKRVGDGDGEHQQRRLPVSAPNFHEVAALIAAVIETRRQGSEQVTLIVHDWGSVTGIQLQRAFPGLVKRMVVMDIGPVDDKSVKMMAGAGLYYQWMNQWAYLLWRYVPVVGESLGDWLHRASLRRLVVAITETAIGREVTPRLLHPPSPPPSHSLAATMEGVSTLNAH